MVISAGLFPAPSMAALYSAAAGYQYTTGSGSYWGHDLWGFGSMRVKGGWYPFLRMGFFNDSFYKGGLAPGGGLEKGFPGLGKARAGYTWYQATARSLDRQGTAHSLELGWFRAFTPKFSGDLAYRRTAGELFGGISRDIVPASGAALSLRHSVFHQGILSLGLDQALGRKTVHWEGGFSGGADSDGRAAYSESLALSVPVISSLSLQAGLALAQVQGNPGRYYLNFGLFYSFAGRLVFKRMDL